MNEGFEGFMLSDVWKGLQFKRKRKLKQIPLYVNKTDGSGSQKVVFKDIEEFDFPNQYTLVGTCSIDNKEHTFEYVAPSKQVKGSTIGFLPIRKEVTHDNSAS